MSLKLRKCHICGKLAEVIMTTPYSKYVKVCLDCYADADKKNKKDFGLPEIKRDTGTHIPE